MYLCLDIYMRLSKPKGANMKRFVKTLVLVLLISLMPVSVYASTEEGVQLENEAESKADSAYDSVQSEVLDGIDTVTNTKPSLGGLQNSNFARNMLVAFYKVYQVIKSTAAVLISLSVLIGVAAMVFARKNKKIRRSFMIAFLLVFPLLILLIVYGIGSMNGVVLHTRTPIDTSTVEYHNYEQYKAVYSSGVSTSTGFMAKLIDSFNRVYEGVRALSIVFVFYSVTIGGIMVALGKYSKKQKNIGLYGFCIGIPVALGVVIFGVPYLNQIFR